MRLKAALVIILAVHASACSERIELDSNSKADGRKDATGRLEDAIRSIEPFFKRMAKPAANDWLAIYPESGQTFKEYVESDPTLPTLERGTIFVLPLGEFDEGQKRVIAIASEYLEAFYGLPVKQFPTRKLPATLNRKDFRIDGSKRKRQIQTGYILTDILPTILPVDAAALIAFTNEDLYPGKSMNYVFGQASLGKRVGVWSLSRLDDNADDIKFLLRTLKIAAHETGHMFSMRHCTKYECVMSGTNNLSETDSRPVDACPECMAKISLLSGVDPHERYLKLAQICSLYGLGDESAEFLRKAAAVKVP
ncbi:MAG: archaemetzincin [Pyrinomonadaceae bacterium]